MGEATGAIEVEFGQDASWALARAEAFLGAEPVANNVISTMLQECAEHADAIRMWLAVEAGAVVGAGFQCRPEFPLMLASMPPAATTAIATAVSSSGFELPGAMGEAGSAALFAGRWADLRNVPALPVEGQRVCELIEFVAARSVSGSLRRAAAGDRAVLLAFLRAFQSEAGDAPIDPEQIIDRALPSASVVLWEVNGEPATMAITSHPAHGVVRVRYVYTAPELREHGYASACVAALSAQIRAAGQRAMLTTDLGNADSNAIYRRLGYRAVVESVHYRFG